MDGGVFRGPDGLVFARGGPEAREAAGRGMEKWEHNFRMRFLGVIDSKVQRENFGVGYGVERVVIRRDLFLKRDRPIRDALSVSNNYGQSCNSLSWMLL